MGFMKFVIPFVGGALTAAAAGVALKKSREEKEPPVEIDVEFEEKIEENDQYKGK